MEIFIIKTPLLDSNMYVLEERGHVVVIDPYWDEKVAALLQNLNAKIDFVYLTHEHYDHISGVQALQETYHTRVFCSSSCAVGLSDPRKNHTRHFDAFYALQGGGHQAGVRRAVQPARYHADDVFEAQYETDWQGYKLCFFETPGHSEGSSSLTVGNKWLFCGDSLTRDAKVITRFLGGDTQALFDTTFPRFRNLPKNMWVFPGHYGLFRLDEVPLPGSFK